ncbi:UNVERIFIED_CONTAM: hypothetical protein Sradi_7210800 [Sesamum radiatum]|uniref:BCD1 alpha/beta domain-containing protein n=1 Tax=Sesamum radiatum TaxID=300843 RepID=A0AAW2IPL3_SESRA
MLEDVKRIADSAQRMRVKLCGCSQFRLPVPLKILRRAAASRRTKLLFLSSGMSKREANRTYYNNRVQEDTTLSSMIEKHLKPGPWNHSLRPFCDQTLGSLKIFIGKYPKGPKSPFQQLNIKAPIREQEEEIEDGESSDPHVSDLMNNAREKMGTEEEPKELVGSPSTVKGVKLAPSVSCSDTRLVTLEDNNMGSNSCIEQLADVPDLDFDFEFEPSLIGVYPDLTIDANTDDFLDFDGILPEHKGLEGGVFLMEEELEEGEMA